MNRGRTIFYQLLEARSGIGDHYVREGQKSQQLARLVHHQQAESRAFAGAAQPFQRLFDRQPGTKSRHPGFHQVPGAVLRIRHELLKLGCKTWIELAQARIALVSIQPAQQKRRSCGVEL